MSYDCVKRPRSTTTLHLFEEHNGKVRLRPYVDKLIQQGGIKVASKKMDVSEQVLENALTYFDLWPREFINQRILEEFRKGLEQGRKPDVKKLADKLSIQTEDVYNALQEESDRLVSLHMPAGKPVKQLDLGEELLNSFDNENSWSHPAHA